MKLLKGKSAQYFRKKFPELRKRYWGMHIWARGYFVSTVGIDRDVIKAYPIGFAVSVILDPPDVSSFINHTHILPLFR